MSKLVQVMVEVTGSVWKIEAAVGQALSEGDVIAIIESMKMEIPIEAPCAGRVREIRYAHAEHVVEGDVFATMEKSG